MYAGYSRRRWLQSGFALAAFPSLSALGEIPSGPRVTVLLAAAINGRADALVTHNVSDFVEAGMRFGLRSVTPGAFLKELKS